MFAQFRDTLSAPLHLAIEHFLHPLLLLGAIVIWYSMEDAGSAFLVALLSAHIVLRICENIHPHHENWKQTPNEVAVILGITFAGLVLTAFIDALYASTISAYLVSLRESANIDLWPDHWPLLAQVFLIYFANEFIFYWIHRGIHNSGFLWKLSGHGFHHSFRNLHAINFLTSHPFELFFLAIPSVLLSYLVGAPPEAVIGGLVLLIVNGSFAHSNIRSSSRWMGLVFTTSGQHSRHHSAVFEESNTNYSCNAIIFDRIFGTYSDGYIEQTGIGPSEPDLVDKLLLPFREPADTRTADE